MQNTGERWLVNHISETTFCIHASCPRSGAASRGLRTGWVAAWTALVQAAQILACFCSLPSVSAFEEDVDLEQPATAW